MQLLYEGLGGNYMDDIDDFLGLDEKITVNDKYTIESYDVFNIVVKEKYIPKEIIKNDQGEVVKTIEKEPQWKIISYHENIEQAFKSIVDREINMTVNEGLEAVVKRIKELKSFKEVITNGISAQP
jgi:hypothetical protein